MIESRQKDSCLIKWYVMLNVNKCSDDNGVMNATNWVRQLNQTFTIFKNHFAGFCVTDDM